MGAESVGHECDAAVMKHHSRCSHIRSVPGFVADRLHAHEMFVVSVLLFLAQLVEVPTRASVIKASVIASLLVTSMNAISATALFA